MNRASQLRLEAMRLSRNQIIGAVLLLAVIWLVIAVRLIIAK